MLLDGTPHVIVGIMPATFSFPTRESAFWTLMPGVERLNEERDNYWFNALGRLKPGVTLEQARVDLGVIESRLERAYPEVNPKNGARRSTCATSIGPLARAADGALRRVALGAADRLRQPGEPAHRAILRATARAGAASGARRRRERLVRQLLTESLLVALAGGAGGVLIAVAAVPRSHS